jgi:hypothetical protein
VLQRVSGACGSRGEGQGVREEGERWSAEPFARPKADSHWEELFRRFQGSGRELRAIGSQACATLSWLPPRTVSLQPGL